MTARPHDVALLPVPSTWRLAPHGADFIEVHTAAEMEAYARANVTAALASAQAREEELRAEVAKAQASVRFGLATQDELRAEVERWRGHYDDMSRRAVEAVDRREDAEARAERLAEALSDALSGLNGLFASGDYPLTDEVVEIGLAIIGDMQAALSTNAATQTGERT